MTATTTERPLSSLSRGDQVECMVRGAWTPATVLAVPCGCHIDVQFEDGRDSRFEIDGGRVRWPEQPEADEIPVYEGQNTRGRRIDAVQDAGIQRGDRVRVTMFSRPTSGNALQREEYDPEGVWTFEQSDVGDANRTFSVSGTIDGVPRTVWVADVERWTEPVSHGETTDPEWPRVGEHVQIPHDNATVYGVVEAVPEDRENQRFQVTTATHGRLYAMVGEMTQPDPLAWAQAVRVEDPEARRLIAAIEEAQARTASTAAEQQQFLDKVQEVASRVANDEDWCGVADTGLAKLGLTRLRDEPATEDVGWQAEVTITVERELDEEDVADLLENHFDMDADNTVDADRTVTISGTVDITVDGTLDEMPEGACVCGSIGRGTIRDALPNWASNLSFEFSEVTCDNDN